MSIDFEDVDDIYDKETLEVNVDDINIKPLTENEEKMLKAINTGKESSQINVAKSPYLTDRIFDLLFNLPNNNVKRAALQNEKISLNKIESILYSLTDPTLINTVLDNPRIAEKPSLYSYVYMNNLHQEGYGVRYFLLTKSSIPEELLLIALDDLETSLAVRAAEHQSATPAVLRKAIQHQDPYIRRRSFSNRNKDLWSLAKGLRDEDSAVRQTASSEFHQFKSQRVMVD